MLKTPWAHLQQPVPASDWWNLGLLFVGILLFIVIAEFIRKTLRWPQEHTRKLVHIAVGLLMFFAPMLLHSAVPLVAMSIFFTISNYVGMKKGWFKGMESDRPSLGTTLYPLAFLILLLFFWEHDKFIIITAMMILALGDAIAAFVGESVSHPHRYRLIDEPKSLEGSAAMFVSSALIVLGMLLWGPFRSAYPLLDLASAVTYAVLVGLVATAAEALSFRGSDNITVPLFSAIILRDLVTHSPQDNAQLIIGTILALLVAYGAYKAKALNPSGMVATFLVGTIIFGFGGWKWAVPILTFFVLSSFLSKVGSHIKQRFDLVFEKTSQRDYGQVIANGGVATALMLWFKFTGNPNTYAFYLAALAAATADTWATEIGVFSPFKPRAIHTFKPVEPGTSGGVTLLGLSGSFMGAAILTVSGLPFVASGTIITFPWVLTIIIAGFLSSIVDSLLGATVQIQYQCPVCQKITEKTVHCNGTSTTPVRGHRWINNDMVNFLSTVSAIIFAGIGFALIR